MNWFTSITVGLEPVLLKELRSYNLQCHVEPGGVSFQADWEKIQECAPYLRSPTSLKLQLICAKEVNRLSDIRIAINEIEWGSLLPEGTVPELKVTCKKSKLNRSDIVKDKLNRILRAILKSDDGETVLFNARIFENKLWFSAQIHDDLLHKRGWREKQVRAPLRENWAAALLSIANWEPEEVLLDPFCGSGTILIEAARHAQQLPCHLISPFHWDRWKIQPQKRTGDPQHQEIMLFGSDKDSVSISKAQFNAIQGNSPITFDVCSIQDRQPPAKTGLIVTNPPFGISSGKRTDAVYQWFGQILNERFTNWRVLFLSPNQHKARLVHPNVECVTHFSNGGIKVGVYVLEL